MYLAEASLHQPFPGCTMNRTPNTPIPSSPPSQPADAVSFDAPALMDEAAASTPTTSETSIEPWGTTLLPSWMPDAVRSRVTGRNAILAVLLAGLAVASAFGETNRFIEATVMLGLPIYVMVTIARRRIKASGLDTVSRASLRAKSRTDTLLWAGTAAARSLPRFGGGFYGLVATLTFLGHQIRELGSAEWLTLDLWSDLFVQASADPFGFLTGTVVMMLWDIALPISATWVTGVVYAVIWPFLILQWGGFWALGVAIACSVIYSRLMPRLWPVVRARAATRNARIAPSSIDGTSDTT